MHETNSKHLNDGLIFQLVSQFDYKVINLVAKWPGSVHDSRILRNSYLFHQFESNNKPLHGKYKALSNTP